MILNIIGEMVDVQDLTTDGVTKYSCGACGYYHDEEEEAQKCCEPFKRELTDEEKDLRELQGNSELAEVENYWDTGSTRGIL